jgi:hypothetical protein
MLPGQVNGPLKIISRMPYRAFLLGDFSQKYPVGKCVVMRWERHKHDDVDTFVLVSSGEFNGTSPGHVFLGGTRHLDILPMENLFRSEGDPFHYCFKIRYYTVEETHGQFCSNYWDKRPGESTKWVESVYEHTLFQCVPGLCNLYKSGELHPVFIIVISGMAGIRLPADKHIACWLC